MATEDRNRLAHKLSDEENGGIFTAAIVPAMFSELSGQVQPRAVFVGGQPGAGKTALQEAIALNVSFDFSTVAKINGDEFRGYHPDYAALNEQDDIWAAFYTDADTGVWVAKAIDLVRGQRSNMLVEGTLRNPNVTIKSARSLTESGYQNELHVVVANEFFSRLRIFSRYLGQRQADGYGRYTLPAAHDASYARLPESLIAIIGSGLFMRVVLYDIERNVLFDSDFSGGDIVSSVSSIVAYVRSQIHQPLDKLLVDVQSMRRLAVELDCDPLVLDDIAKLSNDIIAAASSH